MLAIDCRSSVGMPKTIHLAVDWHHNESPPRGRSAVEWLRKSCESPFAVNTAKSSKSVNRDDELVSHARWFSGETKNADEDPPGGLNGRPTAVLRG
jgi:hypothetical protein